MATITDAAINDWWNDCRVLEEAFEALKIRMDSENTRYNAEISAKLALQVDGDLIDLRVAEGIPISTKAQMVTWVANMQAMLTANDDPGRHAGLVFPAVRSPL